MVSTEFILAYHYPPYLLDFDSIKFTEFGKLLLHVNLYGYICLISTSGAIHVQMMFHKYDEGYRNFVKQSTDFSYSAHIIIMKVIPIIGLCLTLY
jgi:hypothetical protein